MKKRIILFIAASVVLLSFTFVARNQPEAKVANEQTVATASTPQSGFAIEDKAEW